MKGRSELFLRMSDNKPPFIGVCFDSEDKHTASVLNSDLIVIEQRETNFELFLEVKSNHVNLRLHTVNFHFTRIYGNLSFTRHELDGWLRNVSDMKRLNFGHVMRFTGRHVLVKTFSSNKPFCLPVSKLFVYNGEDNKILKILR